MPVSPTKRGARAVEENSINAPTRDPCPPPTAASSPDRRSSKRDRSDRTARNSRPSDTAEYAPPARVASHPESQPHNSHIAPIRPPALASASRTRGTRSTRNYDPMAPQFAPAYHRCATHRTTASSLDSSLTKKTTTKNKMLLFCDLSLSRNLLEISPSPSLSPSSGRNSTRETFGAHGVPMTAEDSQRFSGQPRQTPKGADDPPS